MTLGLSDSARWNEIGGELVALNIESGRYFSLNSSARRLWLSLVDGCDENTLSGILEEHFAIDSGRSKQDVNVFLNKLNDAGLLRRT
jgi:hypothetical protein